MPQFVTRILRSRRGPVAAAPRAASIDAIACAAHAYRRRLASLRTPAPDTLRARVQREVREAVAAGTARLE